MIGRAKKMPKPNTGIKCLVNNCDYYSSGNYCTAQEIEIKSKLLANTSEMTDCATFILKDLT